jgi:hypothetical protein
LNPVIEVNLGEEEFSFNLKEAPIKILKQGGHNPEPEKITTEDILETPSESHFYFMLSKLPGLRAVSQQMNHSRLWTVNKEKAKIKKLKEEKKGLELKGKELMKVSRHPQKRHRIICGSRKIWGGEEL